MEALLIYNLIWSLLSSRFLTGTIFLRQYIAYLFFSSSPMFDHPVVVSVHLPHVARALRINKEREMQGWSGRNNFVRVCAELFWRATYYANPRPETDYQSGYLSLRGLGRRYTWTMWDYDLTTTIVIQLLNQPRKCEMGSSIFSAMSQLKFVSMTRASFTRIPSTERTNGDFYRFSWKCLPCFSVFTFPCQSRSIPIVSFLWYSQYGSPSMTSIMDSVWLYHKTRMRTSDLVSNPSLPWRSPPSDLLRTWWIRASLNT